MNGLPKQVKPKITVQSVGIILVCGQSVARRSHTAWDVETAFGCREGGTGGNALLSCCSDVTPNICGT